MLPMLDFLLNLVLFTLLTFFKIKTAKFITVLVKTSEYSRISNLLFTRRHAEINRSIAQLQLLSPVWIKKEVVQEAIAHFSLSRPSRNISS